MDTKYAPAGRAKVEILNKQIELFSTNKTICEMAEAISMLLVILNSDRQIVFANSLFFKTFGSSTTVSLLGLRPGEAAGCIHSSEEEAGCGTSEFCRTCGAVNAILESQSDVRSEKECMISTDGINSIDFRVTATPFRQDGELFTIFSIIDISNEKRKQALERVFFHDVLNSASGIHGLSSILSATSDPDEIPFLAKEIEEATDNLIEEIKSQRELSRAERGDLVPAFEPTESLKILTDTRNLYSKHDLAVNKEIVLDPNAESVVFTTDPVLLRRIFGNMAKNALEASASGSIITFSCKLSGKKIVFTVHNQGQMDRDVQLQMFMRSFSTKGTGRGAGTYSMKLLGEKYLGGKVMFTSSEENGTTFFIELNGAR